MVTDDDNATIERMVSEGKSAMAIRAAVPNVSRTNVYLKIAKFKKHGTVGRVQTKTLGRPRAMSEGVDKFLQGLLAAKPDMELDEMRRHLQKELELTVSMSTISRAIARAGIAPGQRPVRTRNTTSGPNAIPRRRAANKPIAQKEPVQQMTQQPVVPLSLPMHVPTHVPLDHLTEISTDAHLLDPWQDLTVPPSQHPHQHPHLQPHHMHALDPSLASAYHSAAVYHHLYADPDPNVMVMDPSPLDVYRSPYAPL
jgi:transposase